jgi:peptide/nickel transport system substrate-binding protein
MFEKKNRFLLMLSLLLVFGLLLAACGGTTPEPAEQPPAAEEPAAEEPAAEEPAAEEPMAEEPAAEEPMAEEPAAEEPMAEEPAERKVATFIWTQEFDVLNPYYTNMWFSSITQQLWNAWAWVYDDKNAPVPVLVTEMPSAENGGVSEDGRVITMQLRDDLVWSDGEPLTADDFVFTYQMIMDPNNLVGSQYPYDLMESVEAADDRTVVITFVDAFVPWAANLWHGILPEHILRPVFDAEGTIDAAEWNSAPTVSAGPYLFEEWESGSFARFVANDNYWLGRPKIDEIFFRFVPDDASQVAALQTGDGDLGTFISYADVPTLEDAGVQIISVASGYNEGWYPYLGEDGHPALQDVRVRQAIAMAFDRFSLNQELLLGLTQPAATFWDNTPYADPSIEPWPYDPAQANALLDEAGWIDTNGDGVRDKDGVELVLTHGATIREVRQDTQAIAQQQLAEVGIQLDIQSFDADFYFASYADGGPCYGELDICEWSDTTSYPDPDIYYWLCSEIPSEEYPDGANGQFLCDEELDGLFQAQLSETDPASRTEIFYEISRLMYEQVYWLGIWQDPDIWALGSRVQNAKISGVNPFFNIMEWDLTS